MRGSRNFLQRGGGGPGQSDKKALTFFSFFFPVFFLVLSLFYWSQMVNFGENYYSSKFQRGSNVFQGGPTFSREGGVQFLIPYKNPYNFWFSRGCPDPLPTAPLPSVSALALWIFLLLNIGLQTESEWQDWFCAGNFRFPYKFEG